MKDIKPLIKLMPFMMLGICALMSFCVHEHWYTKAYGLLSQVIGFSICTNIYFLYFIARNKMCNYSLVATIGLLSLNMLDAVNVFFKMPEFYGSYNALLTYLFFTLTLLFYVFKKHGASN